MPSLSQLRNEARELAEEQSSETTRRLFELIAQLANEADRVERLAERAERNAQQALIEIRSR